MHVFILVGELAWTLTFYRDVLQRSNDAWAFIPPHLHYDESCWQLNLPIPICVMLLAVFLEHLRTQFLLQRLLCRHWPAAKGALIKVSMQLLSTVMVLTSPRIQCAEIRREAAWMVSTYRILRGLRPQTLTYQHIASAICPTKRRGACN